MTLKKATQRDSSALANLFIGHLQAHPEYISHGEIQMGVGERIILDGTVITRLAPQARQKWLRYIREHLNAPDGCVWKVVGQDGTIAGFAVADVEEDGDAPFGMVCDVLVKEEYRGQGAGGMLLEAAVGWLREKGVKDIYLESGKDNHSAHRFFERRGFTHISEIYKLL